MLLRGSTLYPSLKKIRNCELAILYRKRISNSYLIIPGVAVALADIIGAIYYAIFVLSYSRNYLATQ